MSCFVTFLLFHERSKGPPVFATRRLLAHSLRHWARPERPERRTGSSHSCCAHRVQRAFSAREVRTALSAPHFCIEPAALDSENGHTPSGMGGATHQHKIPVRKVFGLRINSLRKYSVRWTCPNLSMSKEDIFSQDFSTQK